MTSTSGLPEPTGPNEQPRPPQSGWTPPPLSAAGRPSVSNQQPADVPTQPQPGSTQIGRFAPRRSLVPVLVGVIGVAVAVMVGYSALRPPTPAPTPSHSASSSPKPGASRNGTPFTAEIDGAKGVWQITDSRWDTDGLSVLVTVTVDSGKLNCTFNALPMDGATAVDAQTASLDPQFPHRTITAGATASGWVHFGIERGTTLVFLRTIDQPQISGLEVAG